MLNVLFGILLIVLIIWSAKKIYFATKIAEHPERYPVQEEKISKKELAIVLSHVQRWRSEGKISREEYDRITDIALGELNKKGE